MSSSTWQTRWQQFQTLPRAIRWLVLTVAAVVAFIVVNDYIWGLSRLWNDKAAALESKIVAAGDIDERERQADTMAAAIVALGPVELPGNLAESREAVTSVVNEVMLKYRTVSDWRFDPKGAATMPEVLRKIMPGKKVERISGELRFDASVEDAMAIIADFESRPEIEAVTTVRMVRQTSIKKLRVNLTIDAWVVSEGAPRRGVANV